MIRRLKTALWVERQEERIAFEQQRRKDNAARARADRRREAKEKAERAAAARADRRRRAAAKKAADAAPLAAKPIPPPAPAARPPEPEPPPLEPELTPQQAYIEEHCRWRYRGIQDYWEEEADSPPPTDYDPLA